MLMNHRYDILAWNDEMARPLLDFGTLPPSRRNAMWLCLVHPDVREFSVHRERVVREGGAHLRAAWAAHPQDRALTDLITECATRTAGDRPGGPRRLRKPPQTAVHCRSPPVRVRAPG
jgi:MmyB-like transcription regulator ligand binding domain